MADPCPSRRLKAARQSCQRNLRLKARRNEMKIAHARDRALPFQKTPLSPGPGMFAPPELLPPYPPRFLAEVLSWDGTGSLPIVPLILYMLDQEAVCPTHKYR